MYERFETFWANKFQNQDKPTYYQLPESWASSLLFPQCWKCWKLQKCWNLESAENCCCFFWKRSSFNFSLKTAIFDVSKNGKIVFWILCVCFMSLVLLAKGNGLLGAFNFESAENCNDRGCCNGVVVYTCGHPCQKRNTIKRKPVRFGRFWDLTWKNSSSCKNLLFRISNSSSIFMLNLKFFRNELVFVWPCSVFGTDGHMYIPQPHCNSHGRCNFQHFRSWMPLTDISFCKENKTYKTYR